MVGDCDRTLGRVLTEQVLRRLALLLVEVRPAEAALEVGLNGVRRQRVVHAADSAETSR